MEGCTHMFPGVSAAGAAVWARWGRARAGAGAAGPQLVQPRWCAAARAGFAAVDPAVGSSSKTWLSAALSCRINKLARETILLQLAGETLFR